MGRMLNPKLALVTVAASAVSVLKWCECVNVTCDVKALKVVRGLEKALYIHSPFTIYLISHRRTPCNEIYLVLELD